MEIRKGFKLSEVGIIPNDWDVKKFIDTTKVITCGLAATPKYVDDSIGEPFLSAQNVQNGKVTYEKYRCISKELYAQITKYNKPAKGDLLYTRVGAGIGEAGVIEDDFEFGIYVSLTLIRVKEKQLYNYYLLHLLNSPKYKFFAKSGQFAGGGVQNLNVQIVREFLIPLPSIEEQTAIANALSDADALVTCLEKLIEKKRAIKQGAMQELLAPKANWLTKKLGEIADANKKWSFTGGPFGSNLKSSDYTETGIRIIQLQNIGDGLFHNESEVYTSNQKADELLSCNIYPGDVILSKMGDPVARACIIPNLHDRYLMCSDGIRLAVDERKYSTYFVYTYINSPVFRLLAENNSTGSTRKRIGLTQLKNLDLILPELKEQNSIAATLYAMDSEIVSLKQKLAKYKMIKQGMMQELLTGKIRLK